MRMRTFIEHRVIFYGYFRIFFKSKYFIPSLKQHKYKINNLIRKFHNVNYSSVYCNGLQNILKYITLGIIINCNLQHNETENETEFTKFKNT